MNAAIADAVTRAIGARVHVDDCRSVGGGSIHAAYRCSTNRGLVFIKLGSATAEPIFVAEAAGLAALAAAHCVRTPTVLAQGCIDECAFLCLEWLELKSPTVLSQSRLGESLAAMHRVVSDRFGFATDNFIGSTPQRNSWCASFREFFGERRLRAQLDLARTTGAGSRDIERGERLIDALPQFIAHEPCASLLHGDLWGGNWGATADGDPVIFDPAAYYGDRETDLAMTRLFGGFGREFYAAYEAAWSLPSGAATRVTLYNLYHVLNHYNLFGGGYLGQARSMIDRLLAEVGH